MYEWTCTVQILVFQGSTILHNYWGKTRVQHMHVSLDVLRCWLKITALIKINFLLWSLKTVAKISFAFKMLLSLRRETERLCKGPEIGAMTQGLSLLASKAGNKDTFQLKWCKKTLTTGRAPHKKGESKNVSMVRLDLGGLLSSSLKNTIFSPGQVLLNG